jgi:hypothetical protein
MGYSWYSFGGKYSSLQRVRVRGAIADVCMFANREMQRLREPGMANHLLHTPTIENHLNKL